MTTQGVQRFSPADLLALLEEQWPDGVKELHAACEQINQWLARGDGAAIYRNEEFGHPGMGHIEIVSYGSSMAQLESQDPPIQLPDIGTTINWRYRLIGTYQGEVL